MIFAPPIIALLVIYALFIFILSKKFTIDFFAEIGTLYMGLFLAYSIIPAFTFIFTKLNSNDSLALLLPNDADLVKHLWRHVLFAFFFSLGYLLYRGNNNLPQISILRQIKTSKKMLFFLIFVTLVCIIYLQILSAPVTNYYENFTRYDHLPWFLKKIASTFIRLKYGFYAIALTILFLNFNKFKFFIIFFIIIICTYEVSDSLGARIIALMILLQAICLYSLTVNKISLKRGMIYMLLLAILFTIIEIGREAGFNVKDAQSNVNNDGYRTATEFASVFYPGYHLYTERSKSSLPPKQFPMFFNDFISIFTFGDFDKWNPMAWYNRYYYPDAEVSPFTIGPIAESAIWGGEIDLAIRAFINGLFFAFLIRFFIKRADKFWVLVIYTYCFSTCILTMKYSVFYHLTPIVKTIIPTFIITWLFSKLIRRNPIKKDLEVVYLKANF